LIDVAESDPYVTVVAGGFVRKAFALAIVGLIHVLAPFATFSSAASR
jgi:hypothetical protein